MKLFNWLKSKFTCNQNRLIAELSIAAVFSSKNEKKTMHNKYCIIDNQRVIDGSYNWSYNAQFNEEHIVIIHSSEVAKMFKGNFDRLYKKYSSKSEIKDIG